MITEGSIEIDAPIDLVFDLTNNDVGQWSLVVISEETVEQVEGGVGTRFHSTTSSEGREMSFDGVVTAYDRPTHSRCELTGQQFDMDVGYWFEDVDGRTRVTQVSVVTAKNWAMSLMFRLAKSAIHKKSCDAVQKELESLKSYCEYKRDAMGRLEHADR